MPFTVFLVALVSFLGIFAGYALRRIAPEERKPLGKHTLALQHLSLFCAFAAVWAGAYIVRSPTAMLVSLALVVLVLYLHIKQPARLYRYRLALSAVALGIFFFFIPEHLLILLASFSFVWFSCVGILHTAKNPLSLLALLKDTLWFPAVILLTLI